MKVQYMSDLHLEFGNMLIPRNIGDVLVLAGDIGVGTSAVEWIKEASTTFKHVIYILGNHEFYGYNMFELIQDLKEEFKDIDNIHFLDNECITIDNIKFAGTTLWANATTYAHWMLNDSRVIRYGSLPFDHESLIHLHKRNLKFLEDNSDADVFITHHCPTFECIDDDRYGDNLANSAYATEIVPMFRDTNVKHWICGHTHNALDVLKDNIEVHQNCRGYYNKYTGKADVEAFNPEKVFEI